MTASGSSPTGLPALSVIGVPGKRAAILELAAEADRRGFAGLASPGVNGNLALCGSLAHVTSRIPFWTSIQPIYHSHATEVAIAAGHIFEVSGGRFRLGLGVSHAPAMERLGIDTGQRSALRKSRGSSSAQVGSLMDRSRIRRIRTPLLSQ